MSLIKNTHTIPEIQKNLEIIMKEIEDFSKSNLDATFFAPFGEKWSMSDNLEHLIFSNGATVRTLDYPKEKLAAKFGTPNRKSLTGEELYATYLNQLKVTGAKSTPPYNPQPGAFSGKEELLKQWKLIGLGLQQGLKNWTEEELEQYQIPHPLLGNLTIREFLLFAIFHSEHHFDAMKRAEKSLTVG